MPKPSESELHENSFWESVISGDLQTVRKILESDESLAGRDFEPESPHTSGFPLCRAAENHNLEMAKLLLEAGADPDAKKNGVDEPREVGMPLMHAFHQANARAIGNYDLVHLILDYAPTLIAYPYCATPFVDCVFNNMWELRDYASGEEWAYKRGSRNDVAELFRQSYSNYLQLSNQLECSGEQGISEFDFLEMDLLRRVVKLGGQPSLFTLVRHEQRDLIGDLLRSSPSEKGTLLDWPQGCVFDNICYAASWCGYPQTIADCMALCPSQFTDDVAKNAIKRAIHSHNRDGGIDQYFELVESQLQFLAKNHAPNEIHNGDKSFNPLHWLAGDFIESSHYGFKCERLGTEEDIIRLAKLFVKFGFAETIVNLDNNQTAAQVAHANGYFEYEEFLIAVRKNELKH